MRMTVGGWVGRSVVRQLGGSIVVLAVMRRRLVHWVVGSQ